MSSMPMHGYSRFSGKPAKPSRAWHYALITTIASVLGGVAGYLIGMFAFELVEPVLHSIGYWDKFLHVKQWFAEWGVWIVFIAGFSPIPYKLFTISAGVLSMAFLPFVIASLIGRGARFFLVSGLMLWGGEKMQVTLRQYIDRLGWLMIVAIVILYFVIKG